MATYQDAIDRLGEKLRNEEAWPDDATKLSEQLHLLYNAAIAVLRGLPAPRLPDVESPTLPDTEVNDFLSYYDLPTLTFKYRPDSGIKTILLDGDIYFTTMALPLETIKELSKSLMHRDRIMFAFDMPSQRIYATNVTSVKINYFQTPPVPVDGSSTYPLSDDNDFELAMSVVAAHVSGETIRDSGQSTFQTFLTQLYGEDIDVE